MLVGGVTTFLTLTTSIYASAKSSIQSFRQMMKRGASSIERTERDVPLPISLLFIMLSFIPVFLLLLSFSNYNVFLSLVMTLFVLIAGFMFSGVGAYISGLVGSSNNPISGVTVATIFTASLVLLLWMGKGSVQGPILSILIGSIVCCAAAVGGDNMQDLKTGYLIGATPWKVQVMQIVGLFAPALILPLILRLLLSAYGIGHVTPEHSNPLPAPQASLMTTIVDSIFSDKLPLNLIGSGAIAGAFVFSFNALVFELLLRRYTNFRIHVLAIALGFYIPFHLTTPIFFGAIAGLIADVFLRKVTLKGFNEKEALEQREYGAQFGLLYCAGLITGEALCGIILAIPIIISRNINVLAIFGTFTDHAWPGAALFTLVLLLLIFVVNERALPLTRKTPTSIKAEFRYKEEQRDTIEED
jgi:putative OPT family oligopeptide transporter